MCAGSAGAVRNASRCTPAASGSTNRCKSDPSWSLGRGYCIPAVPSLHISVHVRSGDPKTDKLDLTTHCLIVFVALDESRQPRPVPRWEPRSDEDLALEKHARQLIELRGNAPPWA